MNILTFDIEEWYIWKNRSMDTEERISNLNSYFYSILDLLDDRGIKATFFCLGGMASDFPAVVKEIDRRGHEVGCHSNRHTWLNKMSYAEVKEDTYTSVDALEQCIGKKIKSYRAPAFSIGDKNEWAFEILAESGIERDASVFPLVRDFGGFKDFGYSKPVIVHYHNTSIKEFPICTTKLLGRDIAYSGGGYFRFFPLWFLKKEISASDYVMTYFHLGDIIPENVRMKTRDEYEAYFKEPGPFLTRYKRYLKSNIGKHSAFKKLEALIRSMDFINLEQADRLIEWGSQPVVKF